MSMCHKAFVLDYAAFEREIAPILFEALLADDTADLAVFIDANRQSLTLPWDASPLPSAWRTVVDSRDVQQVADIALTKFYDADEDHGLQEHWTAVSERLPNEARLGLLGEPFGPTGALFDPGRMGSYVQEPDRVEQSLQVLRRLCHPELGDFCGLLERAVSLQRGLYVTF